MLPGLIYFGGAQWFTRPILSRSCELSATTGQIVIGKKMNFSNLGVQIAFTEI